MCVDLSEVRLAPLLWWWAAACATRACGMRNGEVARRNVWQWKRPMCFPRATRRLEWTAKKPCQIESFLNFSLMTKIGDVTVILCPLQKFPLALSMEIVEMMYQTRHEANASAGLGDWQAIGRSRRRLGGSSHERQWWWGVGAGYMTPPTRKTNAELRVIVLEVGIRENGMRIPDPWVTSDASIFWNWSFTHDLQSEAGYISLSFMYSVQFCKAKIYQQKKMDASLVIQVIRDGFHPMFHPTILKFGGLDIWADRAEGYFWYQSGGFQRGCHWTFLKKTVNGIMGEDEAAIWQSLISMDVTLRWAATIFSNMVSFQAWFGFRKIVACLIPSMARLFF